jgi:hypothetical protein
MSFASKVQDFMKSLSGGEGKDGGEPDPDIDLDLDDEDGDEGAVDGGDEDKGDEEGMKKGLVDATEILGSLVAELKDVNKSLNAVIAGQADAGEAVVGVAQMVVHHEV